MGMGQREREGVCAGCICGFGNAILRCSILLSMHDYNVVVDDVELSPSLTCSLFVPTNRLLSTAIFLTNSWLRKHIAYSNIKVLRGDKTLTLVYSDTYCTTLVPYVSFPSGQ